MSTKKARNYKQVIRSAARANTKAVAELTEAKRFLLPPEEQDEVNSALGAAKVLGVVLGNIQFDAEGP